MAASTRSNDAKNDATANRSAGSKHQADEKPAPQSKRVKKAEEKEQKTIEETMPSTDDAEGEPEDVEPPAANGEEEEEEEEEGEKKEESSNAAMNGKNDTAEEPKAREGATPASILEKGIIYFFLRGRVGVGEQPGGVDEIQRTYIVLRPMDPDAKLGEGPIGDAGNARLLAVPKKRLPRSGRERWIALVEKTDASFRTLRDGFLASSDYETKTAGHRHAPAATPVGEGVYAVTAAGRASHLAYVLTLPADLGEVQQELGLRERGSFVVSTRNPQYAAPGGVSLPDGPEYPEDIQEEFRSRRWMPTTPRHLGVVGTQVLLVGDSSGIQKATEPQEEDQEDGKEEPLEEMEKLEDEDTHRVQALQGDDSAAIYADLEVRAKDYPKMQTTF